MMEEKRKMKHADTDDVESEKENSTEDIYDDAQREKMLEEDEITAAESAFMEGREMKPKDMKRRTKSEHSDTVSVELAEDEYSED